MTGYRNFFKPGKDCDFDVIVTHSAGSEALWFGAQLAFDLAQISPGPVRLFTDCMAELATCEGRTTHRGTLRDVSVIDHKDLSVVKPARNSIVVFNSILPRAYESRRAAICENRFRLMPVGANAGESLATQGECELRIGIGRNGEGVIRPSDRQVLLADRLHRLRTRPNDRVRTVMLAPRDGIDLSYWLSLLAFSKCHVVVLAGSPRGTLHEAGTRCRTKSQSTSVTWLNERGWLANDRMLAQCDLLLCADTALAVRSVAVGVPVINLSFDAGAGSDCIRTCRTIFSWSQPGVAIKTRQALGALSLAWALDVGGDEAWPAFVECWDDVIHAAAAGGVKFHARPTLAGYLQQFVNVGRPPVGGSMPPSLDFSGSERFLDTLPMSTLAM